MISECEFRNILSRRRTYWKKQFFAQRSEFIQGVIAGFKEAESLLETAVARRQCLDVHEISGLEGRDAARMYLSILMALKYFNYGDRERGLETLRKALEKYQAKIKVIR